MYENKNLLDNSAIVSPDLKIDSNISVPADQPISVDMNKGELVEEITQQILNSQPYQEAYSIFSADKKYGKIYLTQLEMIPYSVAQPEQTGWDKIGWSNKYDNQMRDSFDKAMTEIRTLVNNYYTFINSLPKSQLAQSIEAGANLTGLNVQSSEMYGVNPQKVGSDIESFSPVDSLLGIGNLALSLLPGVVTPVTNAISSLVDLGLSRQQLNLSQKQLGFNIDSFTTQSWRDLAEAGVDVSTMLPDNASYSFDDLKSVMTTLFSDDKYTNLQDQYAIKAIWSSLERMAVGMYDEPVSSNGAFSRFGSGLSDLLDDIAQFSLDQFRYSLGFRSEQSKYNYEYQSKLVAGDAAGATNAQNRALKIKSNFEKMQNSEKMKFYKTQIDRCSKNYDPISKFLLSQMMFNDPWLSAANAGFELNSGLNNSVPYGDLLNPLNGGLLGASVNIVPKFLGSK